MTISRPLGLATLAMTTIVACVATLVVCIAPAQAITWGQLWAKGTGGLYARASIIHQGVVPGGAAGTWSYKIVNPGPAPHRFEIDVDRISDGLTATLSAGGKQVTAPYETRLLAPGASQVVTLKLAAAPHVPQGWYSARVSLTDPEYNWELAESFAIADATYQRGTTSHDLFLKAGSQPFVGGSISQYETASALQTGTGVTFILRAQNNGSTPARIYVNLRRGGAVICPGDFAVRIRQRLTDVTGAVRAGTYSVLLAPGARSDLTMTVRETASSPCDPEDYFDIVATGPDGQVTQYAHLNIAS
jgi:hypothetical protein